MAHKGRGETRVKSTEFKELYLDPDCDFVAIKSAESDGVGSVVALEHFENCTRCQAYHKAMAQKKGLALGIRVQREVDRLREERDTGLRAIQHAQRLAKARLGLLLAYFDDSLIGKIELLESANYPQQMWYAATELKTKPPILLRANSHESKYQYMVKGWPHWSGEIAQIDLVLKNVAAEMAKDYLNREGKGEKDGQG
jgi:hypothetical protein